MKRASVLLLALCTFGCGNSREDSRAAAEAHGINLPHNGPAETIRDQSLKEGWCYCTDAGESRCKNADGSMLTLVGGCGETKLPKMYSESTTTIVDR